MNYLNRKKRIPEPEEEMEGSTETKGFFGGSKKHNNRTNTYERTTLDIKKRLKIQPNKIVDFGCGFGGVIKELAEEYPHAKFTGIEVSKSMISLAKKYTRGIKVQYIKSNAENTKQPNNYFDFAICTDTFHHFKNPIKVLKEMHRITKPKGWIYLNDLKRNCPDDVVLQIIQKCSESSNLMHAIQFADSIKAAYTVTEIKQLLKKAGFKKFQVVAGTQLGNFVKSYGLKKGEYLSAKNFFHGRWFAIVKNY